MNLTKSLTTHGGRTVILALSMALISTQSADLAAAQDAASVIAVRTVAATATDANNVSASDDVDAGVSCGWCEDFWLCWSQELGYHQCHIFPNGADECGIGADPEAECSRCGGTSECHEYYDPGDCHLDCGPGGGLLATTLHDLQEAFDRSDHHAIARLVATTPALTLSIDGLSIQADATCLTGGVLTYSMPAHTGRKVAALLLE